MTLDEKHLVEVTTQVIREGDLNVLTLRKVKEIVKERIHLTENYDDQLTKIVKRVIEEQLCNLQQQKQHEVKQPRERKRKKHLVKENKESKLERAATSDLCAVTKNENAQPKREPSEAYHQLTKICRKLGVGLPVSKLKGIASEREKMEIIKDFLYKKGVKRDPLQLSDKQLKSFREKIERDKELESLDRSNILEDSRRKRTTRPVSRHGLENKVGSSDSSQEDSEVSEREEHDDSPIATSQHGKVRHRKVEISDDEKYDSENSSNGEESQM
eukprot:jgi/Galph1/6113/GphlegSOOS_G4667.1